MTQRRSTNKQKMDTPEEIGFDAMSAYKACVSVPVGLEYLLHSWIFEFLTGRGWCTTRGRTQTRWWREPSTTRCVANKAISRNVYSTMADQLHHVQVPGTSGARKQAFTKQRFFSRAFRRTQRGTVSWRLDGLSGRLTGL